MVTLTPERTGLLALLLFGLWGALQWRDFLADVDAFRAHAAATLPPPRPARPAAPPATGPLVSIRLPDVSDVPPAYATDSIVPLVYRLEPDEPGEPVAPGPATPPLPLPVRHHPFLTLSPPPPDLGPPNLAPPHPATPDPAPTAYAALAAGQVEQAARLFRAAIAHAPRSQIAADLAYASLRLGQRREAARAFRDALALGAPSPEAEQTWRQDAARLDRQLLLSAYVFHREDQARGAFAAAGVSALGGSQSALVLQYRPDPLAERPLVLHARLLAAHDGQAGESPLVQTAQAMAGLGWIALPAINGTLVAERWIKAGDQSRGAFALRAHGGYGEGYGPAAAETFWPHWSLFGEAAVVGARRRDLFAAAEARAGYGLALGQDARLMLTGALWAMMQHDDRTRHRIEAGPSLGLDLRLGGLPLHLRLDYRLPLAVAPDSGGSLALTVATGF